MLFALVSYNKEMNKEYVLFMKKNSLSDSKVTVTSIAF